VLTRLNCARCGASDAVFRSLGRVTEDEGRCPGCKQMREVKTISTIYGGEDFLHLSFRELGVPPFDIITARDGDRRLHIEFGGDRATVLGALCEDFSE